MDEPLSRDHVLAAHPTVPGHVVYRSFVKETIVLNLQTGTYHGLNTSGSLMLEVLGSAETVRDAAEALAAHYDQPLQRIEDDLYEFCVTLHERGLVDLTNE